MCLTIVWLNLSVSLRLFLPVALLYNIQESPRTWMRILVLNLVRQFSLHAWRCRRHQVYPAFPHVCPGACQNFRSRQTIPKWFILLPSTLEAGFYQRSSSTCPENAIAMSKLGGDYLVAAVFLTATLDDDSSVQGVGNLISSWLHQTVFHGPSAWIGLCQRIVSCMQPQVKTPAMIKGK